MNILSFKKSEYLNCTARELVDNCVDTLQSIKQMNAAKIKVPKPHKEDSLSADIINPDMNV